jgi:hypothetical protein
MFESIINGLKSLYKRKTKRVIRIKKDFPKGIIHKTIKVPGIKPDAYGYVPADLSPSQIGIPGTKPLSNNLY